MVRSKTLEYLRATCSYSMSLHSSNKVAESKLGGMPRFLMKSGLSCIATEVSF